MKIKLLFFATLKNRFRSEEATVEIDRPCPAQELFLRLFSDRSEAGRFLPSTRFAVNCEYVPSETLVHDGDELAFIPPVSGG
ncbi:MAG: MoaD/ThiS family protein [Deltaproteobacteria bacterium]|nr:MoaD/ThiS family protein [Deltaproteobacteria bacterium]